MDSRIEIYLLILFSVVVMMSMCILIFEIILKNRNNRYNEEKNRIELDKTREYYEERLYRIQTELMENERRWVDVNNLILSAPNKVKTEDNGLVSETILKNFGVDNSDFVYIEDAKSVFVLTPFLEREFDTFEIIKKTCVDVNLKCTRGDEVFRDKDILSHIITSIAQSSVIIANLNGRNPNVFYELGICHSMGKPVILISKNKSNVPFDIQNKNVVFYSDLSDLQIQLKNELLKIFIDKK